MGEREFVHCAVAARCCGRCDLRSGTVARIFVIDDNPLNLRLLSLMLQKEGHEIEQAEDAEKALRLLERSVPELFLIDIALPGMDGLSLLRLLKADPRFKSVPMVVLTAFAMKGDEEKAFAAGCDDYVTKPIDTRALPKQIAGWLSKAGQAGGDGQ
ncbi:MAG: response regulator [Proteobacteria bacterium]|nr:response regulator [Pseudomonadota bacterium]